MFIGAINATVRAFLANTAQLFNEKIVVVGCSGNFTIETILAHYARPAAIHANDVSVYSCMAGRWLTGQALDFEIADPDYAWLEPHLAEGGPGAGARRLAVLMTLMEMISYEKQNNPHKVRMWGLYQSTFAELVDKTVERLNKVETRLTSFYEGDVFEHFYRFEAEPEAVFCCYAPTYAGGYERLYKRLEEIIRWDAPDYDLLDDERRDQLIAWMSERRFLWYDDRRIEGMQPIMEQRAGRSKTVYLYSNFVTRPAYFNDRKIEDLPPLPLAGADFEIRADSTVQLAQIKTADLSRFKDAFLSKDIDHGQGWWGFAIYIDQVVIGFIEFRRSAIDDMSTIYMMSDFAVHGTRYKRLSKLVAMLAKAGQTRKVLERLIEFRLTELMTTAFTNRPVSMKYRGVLQLVKRGETAAGKKFLNYGAEFDDLSWAEVLGEWLTKHGSMTW